MSNGIALVKYLCPICGKVAEENILIGGVAPDDYEEPMDEVLIEHDKKKFQASRDYVDSVNGKPIGWANKCCDECAKNKDKVVYIIGIDSEKSESNNPYRTGQIVGIKKDVPFIKQFKDYIITLEDDTKLIFMDESAGKQLGLWK